MGMLLPPLLPNTSSRSLKIVIVCSSVVLLTLAIVLSIRAYLASFPWLNLFIALFCLLCAIGLWGMAAWARSTTIFILFLLLLGVPFILINPFRLSDDPTALQNLPVLIGISLAVIVAILIMIHVLQINKAEFRAGFLGTPLPIGTVTTPSTRPTTLQRMSRAFIKGLEGFFHGAGISLIMNIAFFMILSRGFFPLVDGPGLAMTATVAVFVLPLVAGTLFFCIRFYRSWHQPISGPQETAPVKAAMPDVCHVDQGGLREMQSVKQYDEDERLRWFSSDDCDLYVWSTPTREINAFQLYYGKPNQERGIVWSSAEGFLHVRVDPGDHTPWKNRTPVVDPDGEVPFQTLLPQFAEVSRTIDAAVANFVAQKLREYAEKRPHAG